MIPPELLTGLAPVRRRLWRRQTLQRCGWGLTGGGGAAVVLLLTARFFPLPYSVPLSVLLVALGVIAGAVWSGSQPPSYRAAAQAVDTYGELADRVSTALHFAEAGTEGHPFILLQRKEAIEQLLRMRDEADKVVAYTFSAKRVRLGGAVLLVVAGLLLWHNPQDDIAKERLAVHKKGDDIADKMQKAADAAEKREGLSAEEKARLQEAMAQLQKELAEAKSEEDLQRALAKAQSRLDAMQNASQQKQADRQSLAQEMAKQLEAAEAGKKLAEALKQNDGKKINEAMQELKKQIAALPEAQQKQLAEALSRASSQAGGQAASSDFQKGLGKAAAALQSGDPSKMTEGVGQLSDLLAEAPDGVAQELDDLAGQMADAASQAGLPMLASQNPPSGASPAGAGAGANGVSGQQPPGGANGSGSSSANGQGASNGSGAGSGQGAGSGSGSGSGQGSGSGNGSGNGGNGSGSGGQGWGSGQGSRELVTVPAGEFGTGQTGNDAGGPLHEGASQTVSGSGVVTPGAARPYQEVYGRYADYARESVERQNLPLGEQLVVRDYFTGIAP